MVRARGEVAVCDLNRGEVVGDREGEEGGRLCEDAEGGRDRVIAGDEDPEDGGDEDAEDGGDEERGAEVERQGGRDVEEDEGGRFDE